ncbi:hypothetical protein M8C21_022964 [Ambrosia artemisiifolia]|uniref:non-specific serine/threonine protein kinase n=1 Tax=Ambrosia artemisiifolia TaxID=4212 RepID=A0AAD5G4Q6_AMBAR|nr:hypothetical protein M8C21_022964 [Ambrosia artemisiifolia]
MTDQATPIFGLHLWLVLGVSTGTIFVLLLFLLSLCFFKHKPNNKPIKPQTLIPITTTPQLTNINNNNNILTSGIEKQALLLEDEPKIQVVVGPEVSHLGWGHWYTLRELEDATDGFAPENVVGEGGYGIVYHGLVAATNTHVAVKNLLNNRGQAEKEFEVEVEAIGRVRHKNLLRLLGYCAEGAHRILVYEYVNNGNLEQWLHGDVGLCSPLTWDIRMKIIIGTAKALTYLHEGLEPKVVHRDIKSSNILLDKLWNPKVSDFGLAKLLGADRSYITTRVMGTLGYVAPEYASTGMVNERSDVYSFGILFMELITGRYPVDYKRPQEEVHLVEWVRQMVNERCLEKVLDPKMIEKPASCVLKRALVVALRCADLNSEKRPKIGHVVHILESQDQPSSKERRGVGDSRVAPHGSPSVESNEKQVTYIGG